MRKLRVFYTRKLGRFVGRCVGLLGVLFLIVNLISCQDDFQENVEPPVTPPEETVTPPVYMLLNGKYKSGVNLTLYNRQIKKFPTEKQNVSLKHILT